MIRLNLGCGDERLGGYVNVDMRPQVADVVADATRLPFADGVSKTIVAYDLLEHLPAARVPHTLAEWRRVLAPDGHLVLRVPNMRRIAKALLADPEDDARHRALIRNVYGGHRWGPDGAWDQHHTGWTPRLLAADLKAAGFAVEEKDDAMNMTVRAVRV